MSDDPVTSDDLRSVLVTQFSAVPRRSWGFEALYHDGRLFAMFDGEELIAKWPDVTRERLRRSVPGIRAFREEDDVRDASWLRVPLAEVGVLEEAVSLALEAAEFVHTAEGAPKSRRMRRRDHSG